MVKINTIEYENVAFNKSNKEYEESFEKRINMIFHELGEIQTKLQYLEYFHKELQNDNDIFKKAEHFMSWTWVSSWHDIIIKFTKLFETRNKSNDLKNIPTLHKFVNNVWETLYNKEFYRITIDSDTQLRRKEQIKTLSKEQINNCYDNFFDCNNDLIKSIIDYRDDKLGHMTFKQPKLSITLEQIKQLLANTQKLLNKYMLNYDNTFHEILHYSYEDHKVIFSKFK